MRNSRGRPVGAGRGEVLAVITKQLCTRLFAESTESLVLQVPRALIASCLAAALDFGILILLVERAGWNAQAAVVAGYLVGGVLQYVLCALWVFPAAPQNVTT